MASFIVPWATGVPGRGPRGALRAGLLLAALALASPATRALPFFEVGQAAGSGLDALAVPLYYDAGGSGSVVSGTLVIGYDPAALAATENCFSLLGFPVATHTLDCTVNAAAGEITVAFDSIEPLANILGGRRRLGTLEFQVLTGPHYDLATFPLAIDSAGFADGGGFPVTAGSSQEGSVRVLATWPIDAYEPDDLPFLAQPGIVSAMGSTQLRAFHDAEDEEWIAFDSGSCDFDNLVLTVRPLNGDDGPESFVPRVEVYDSRRFTLLVAPVLTYGQCDGSPGPVTIVTPANDILESSLVRIRSCEAPPAGGLAYEIIVQYALDCPFDPTLVKGNVLEEGSNAPASVFVMADNARFTISDPGSGAYALSLTAGQGVNLSIVSPVFVADPLAVDPVPPGEISEGNDIVVRRIDLISRIGFE